MDKLNEYRQAIKQILTYYSQIKPAFGDIERYTAFDNAFKKSSSSSCKQKES